MFAEPGIRSWIRALTAPQSRFKSPPAPRKEVSGTTNSAPHVLKVTAPTPRSINALRTQEHAPTTQPLKPTSS